MSANREGKYSEEEGSENEEANERSGEEVIQIERVMKGSRERAGEGHRRFHDKLLHLYIYIHA